jgi:hypothetical protein
MRNIFAAFSNRGTSGGPGATDPPSSPSFTGQAEATFSLSVPSVDLNQGSTIPVTIGIHRGQNFGQDVSLMFGALPKGISFTPACPQIKHGDSDTEILLTALNDAALGDFTISVTGQPASGAEAVGEMKVSIEKHED